MELLLFIFIWLVSPVVLLILFLVQLSNTSNLRKQNAQLLEKIKELIAQRDGSAPQTLPQTENTVLPETAGAVSSEPDSTALSETAKAEVSKTESPKPFAGEKTEIAENSDAEPFAEEKTEIAETEAAKLPEAAKPEASQAKPSAASAPKPAPIPYNMPMYYVPAAQNPNAASAVTASPAAPRTSGTSSAASAYSGIAGTNSIPAGQEAFAPIAEIAEKKSVSTINIILILGALLISLAGFIFASATWDSLNMFFKTALLLSFSAVFFGIHSIAERKLKLVQTGRIFYILGSIFLPAAIAAAGALNVFGEYFSFSGDGWATILAAMFFSVCIPFFKGAYDYKFRAFAAVSFAGFSASVVSLIWQISPGGDVTALAMAVFALIIILTEPVVRKFFISIFGEECIFAPEWTRFSSLNAWVLSFISLFATEGGFVSLAAFTLFSVCFLRKSLTDKDGTAGVIAFAFFITTALFTGFEPDEMSSVTVLIAATSLIYTVLSAMGIFPDALKKIMKVLAIIAAGAAALLGIAENIALIAENETPSLSLVFAAAAIFAQLLILALRNKTGEYKAMSFGAMLWLSAEVMLLAAGSLGEGFYPFAAAYGFMLIYFAATRFTGLKKWLYSTANDIIIAVFAFLCAMICNFTVENIYGGIIGLGILFAGIILSAVSRHGKFSAVICPALTGAALFPLGSIFRYTDLTVLRIYSAAGGTLFMLICLVAAAMLFIPKAQKYAVSYGIAVIAFIPVFTAISLAERTSDPAPMLAVVAYSVIFLLRYAIPKEKYSCIMLPLSAIVLASFFIGRYFTDEVYLFCFPAVALMLIFAVHVIAISMGGSEKLGEHSEKFLWFVMPAFSGILIFNSEAESCLPLLIFGAALLLCSVFLSMFRKNTFNLIFPLFTAFYIFSTEYHDYTEIVCAVTAIVLAAAGRLIFSKKMFSKLYADVLSIGAIAFACVFIENEGSDISLWLGIILLAATAANLIRKEHSPRINRIVLTIAAIFIFPIWWCMPFFEIPSLIKLEWTLLPAVLFCILLRFIWRENLSGVYNFSFITAIVCLAVLFLGALASGESFDSVFIGIVLLIMLAVSFIIKRKRWFVLAVASMVVSAALLSIQQLESIAWLVYLALTGAALIALGVVNEIKKQQKRSGEETKLTRFMSDWTW